MKILIIGGSRFVGPYIVKMLLKHGHRVTLFNRGEIQEKYDKNISFIKGDRNNGFKIDKKFDAVIDTCSYNDIDTKTAVTGLNFDYFLNFSSVAVYEDPVTFPLSEEAPIRGFKSMGDYGTGKANAERYLMSANISYCNIRPTYILGPKNYVDRENFIYSRLLHKKPIIIPGNGEALAQFVFAEEVAKSIVVLTENKVEGSFNCAGDEFITLNNLVKSMAKIAGVEPIIRHNPKTDGVNLDESEFPFANDNFIFTNDKIKKLGITFTPLLKGINKDYRNYYKNISIQSNNF